MFAGARLQAHGRAAPGRHGDLQSRGAIFNSAAVPEVHRRAARGFWALPAAPVGRQSGVAARRQTAANFFQMEFVAARRQRAAIFGEIQDGGALPSRRYAIFALVAGAGGVTVAPAMKTIPGKEVL